MNRRDLTLAALAAPLVPGIGRAATPLDRAIAGAGRSQKNIARDYARHPAAMLAFFGLTPDQDVVEAEPGGGYWTEILAPYLRAHGAYTAALSGTEPKARAFFVAKFVADPAAWGKIGIIGLDGAAPAPVPGSADMVLSFRNLHDWLALGTAGANLAMFHTALRPGGIFGIEDHRGDPTAPQDPAAKSGYVRQDYAIALIERAGFRLAASSELGANPKDTRNYPAGVWTLPPTLRLGDEDRAKYVAIGESDRFTLKFVRK